MREVRCRVSRIDRLSFELLAWKQMRSGTLLKLTTLLFETPNMLQRLFSPNYEIEIDASSVAKYAPYCQ